MASGILVKWARRLSPVCFVHMLVPVFLSVCFTYLLTLVHVLLSALLVCYLFSRLCCLLYRSAGYCPHTAVCFTHLLVPVYALLSALHACFLLSMLCCLLYPPAGSCAHTLQQVWTSHRHLPIPAVAQLSLSCPSATVE